MSIASILIKRIQRTAMRPKGLLKKHLRTKHYAHWIVDYDRPQIHLPATDDCNGGGNIRNNDLESEISMKTGIELIAEAGHIRMYPDEDNNINV
jgi:hypothetical protein